MRKVTFASNVFRVFVVVVVVSVGWLSARIVNASMGQKTVWSAVYSDGQAGKGQAIYSEYCSGCHSPNLEGGAYEGAPPLKGDKFMENWREDNLQSMFTKIITTMPRRNESKVLSEEETLDVMSYILKMNEFPAGTDLNVAALKDIQIEGKDGPKPLPNYAKVQVVGCMTQEGDNWILSNASAPKRNRNSDNVTDGDLKLGASIPLENLKFSLQNLLLLGAFDPAMHKGHKMLAAGVLIKQGNTNRLSVTDLKMVNSACPTSK